MVIEVRTMKMGTMDPVDAVVVFDVDVVEEEKKRKRKAMQRAPLQAMIEV